MSNHFLQRAELAPGADLAAQRQLALHHFLHQLRVLTLEPLEGPIVEPRHSPRPEKLMECVEVTECVLDGAVLIRMGTHPLAA